LAAFYDQSSRYVFGIAQRMLGSREDAEEVALDVYKQIWRGPRGYDSSRGSVASWLTTMTRSRALDRIRSRAARGRIEQPWEPDSGIEPATEGFEQNSLMALDQRRITAALMTLPPEQRQLIEMAFFAGLSHGELAERLATPLGTVKTRIRQGMMKLRESLGEAH
jgi:RNA polymerase sigma-70 factor, ECF subfamily